MTAKKSARAVKNTTGAIVPKAYTILRDCVEAGTCRGWNLAHNDATDPPEDDILERIEDEIMLEICEHFHFPDLDLYGGGE